MPLYENELELKPETTVIKQEALRNLEESFLDWEPTYSHDEPEETLVASEETLVVPEVQSTSKAVPKSSNSKDNQLLKGKESLDYTKVGRLYFCKYCDKRFKEKRYVCDHLALKHSVGEMSDAKIRGLEFIACEVCGKLVRRQYMLSHVQSIHEQVVKAECDICGMKFYNKSRIQTHIVSHIPAKYRNQMNQCDVCKQLFTTVYSLRTHINHTHRDVPRSFICHCGATFKLGRNLRQHVKHIHTLALERQACKYCAKEFSVSTVKKHEAMVHEKNFKYICDYKDCDKRFYLKDRLARHVNTFHLKLKPFQCTFPGCTMAFGLKDVLSVHYSLKHLKLRETCPVDGCKYSVGRRHYMRMHLKKHDLSDEDICRYSNLISEMNLLP